MYQKQFVQQFFFHIEGALRAPLISARLIHFHTALRRSHFTDEGLGGSTLGLKWDPSLCGPLEFA